MNPRRRLVMVVLGGLAASVTVSRPGQLPAADAPLVESSIAPDVQDILFLGPTRPVLIRLHITIDGQPFRELWQQRFEENFAQEDRDADGRLDLEQAAAVVREMNGALGETASNLKEIMPEGTIDRAALADYIERTLPRFALKPRAVIGQGAALALFPLLDTDHDHRLTAAELADAEAQLVERDFDDNGVVTAGELILDPKAIAAASDPTAEESDLDPEETPVLAIEAATSASQFADRLLAHYDADRDGRLTADGPKIEIKLPASLLNAWDENGDRVLTRNELSQVALWRPDLELSFAMGQASVRSVRSHRSPPSPEGFRVRKKLLGGYHLDLGEAEINFDRNNRDPRQADLVQLRNFDRDNNGYLDLAEAGANNIGASAFKAMDVDGNGKVFKGELTSFMSRQNAAASARLHLIIRDLGQDLFGEFDFDMDGLLSKRELRQARVLLNVEDKNGDGMLGFDEVPARLEFELVRGVDERAGADARLMRRVVRPTDRAETTGPLWFRKMDRNNDGDVSPAEFVGPRATFDRLDADGDGLVDRAEAEAADKK
jgi:Ca2+-binding EF-hand superfamily protein